MKHLPHLIHIWIACLWRDPRNSCSYLLKLFLESGQIRQIDLIQDCPGPARCILEQPSTNESPASECCSFVMLQGLFALTEGKRATQPVKDHVPLDSFLISESLKLLIIHVRIDRFALWLLMLS